MILWLFFLIKDVLKKYVFEKLLDIWLNFFFILIFVDILFVDFGFKFSEKLVLIFVEFDNIYE